MPWLILMLVIVAIVGWIATPFLMIIGLVIAAATFSLAYELLGPYIPSKEIRGFIIALWIGAYLFFMGKAMFNYDEYFMYLPIAIATFWVPAILVWIIASTSKKS